MERSAARQQSFVPFGRGNRETEGYVVAIRPEADYEESKIKEILRVNTEGSFCGVRTYQGCFFLKRTIWFHDDTGPSHCASGKSKNETQEGSIYYSFCRYRSCKKLLAEWEQKHYVARARFLFLLIEKGRITKEEASKGCNFPLKEIRRLAEQGIVKLESRIKYTKIHSQSLQREVQDGRSMKNSRRSQTLSERFMTMESGGLISFTV